MIDWTPLADLVEKYDRFLLTTHIRPDGDALGSEVGMAGLLRQKGKDVRVVNTSRTPPRYDYLDPDGTFFEHFSSLPAGSLDDREVAVILDLSAWSQLGDMADFFRGFRGPKVVVDHHVSQDDLGAVFLKDTSAEAAGTLVMRAIKALGGSFTKEVATGLFTAIAMDTGWFRHPNTKPSTLLAASELIEAGAEIDRIYRDLFERNTLAGLRLTGEFLAGMKTDLDGRVAYSTVSLEDLERTGSIPSDTEDLVDYTVSLRGVEIGLLLIELPHGGVKGSLRSRAGADCARIAAEFGGGGHKAAAGLSLPGPLPVAVDRVLAAVRKALDPTSVGA
ncbi:DHH family phosphoesterase [Planctomyces sp. SH-PL62]|uniref:DHH family phosphoesterase n=1 Tax=Planctomyces sp. SH-PL62 TaxID=1636152 RepID=UPI00078B563F|nr:DHH family phosphoesterase [Planctomyces sp. SH-PL62]AMV36734.1 Bifunctional oligoribonuclease and PAP phosphatase NrnA [Planctomyces sp. SH-PL62]